MRWEGDLPRAYREYSESGRLRSILTWHGNGRVAPYLESSHGFGPHGVSEAWYADGTPRWSRSYEWGKLEGSARYWHSDGSVDVSCSGIYEEGRYILPLPPGRSQA